MARHKGILHHTGHKKSKHEIGIMLLGAIFGIGIDAFYSSLKLPGGTHQIKDCPHMTVGDAIQLSGEGAMTGIGILSKNDSISAFFFGMLGGSLIPKVITPAFNLPRYILFGFEPKTGAVSPVFRGPG